jgi:photosystem II stability/assembly factor-like uncharacterized protein
MSHRLAFDRRPRRGRHNYVAIVATVLLASFALALLICGCGSDPVGGGAASTPSSPIHGPAPVDAATTWMAQDASGAAGPAWLDSITFVDATHGWAVGYKSDSSGNPAGGLILVTSDGGATWQAQDASSAGGDAEFYSVSFVDAKHGWVVGDESDSSGVYMGSVVLATRDGGATWHAQSRTGNNAELYSVTFVDAKHGWAVGHKDVSNNGNPVGLILATSNGGATWRAQDASSAGSGVGLDSVSFVDAVHGWAVGGRGDDNGDSVDGVILATSDGGTTWQAQDASSAGSPTGLNAVSFVDATHGWAVGARGGSNGSQMGHVGVILATSDGGTTWQVQDASSAGGDAQLYSVSFVDATHGWAVGDSVDSDKGYADGAILTTSNGGATWQAQNASSAGSPAELDSVSFVDATHGWAAGHRVDSNGSYTDGVVLATGK